MEKEFKVTMTLPMFTREIKDPVILKAYEVFELYGLEFGVHLWVDGQGRPTQGRWVCSELSTGTRVDMWQGPCRTPAEALERGKNILETRGEAQALEAVRRTRIFIELGRYI